MMRLFPLLLVGACTWVGDSAWDRVQDADGDGVLDERFGGPDCRWHDPDIGDCDADGDEHVDVRAGGDDCDDTSGAIHPGAPETCDGLDDDCDGLSDDDDPDLVAASWHPDDDGDGFGRPDAALVACAAPPGRVRDGRDCDDNDGDVHPGLPEFCGPPDQDCDGDDELGSVDATDFVADADQDGFGPIDGAALGRGCDAPAGAVRRPAPELSDCDDDDPAVHPGAVEVAYDDVDDDCDPSNDDDGDHDGAALGEDCDDADPAVHPGAAELCNGRDDDCDLRVDDEDDSVGGNLVNWYLDADGDGHGGGLGSPVAYCPATVPNGRALVDDDCDDAAFATHPNAAEFCDGVDNDCNTLVDEGAIDLHTWFHDGDGDGHGSPFAVEFACSPVGDLVARGDDCDDTAADVHPGATEVCGDAIRQDCRLAAVDDCDGDGESATADCDDTRPEVAPSAPEVCDGLDNDCDGFADDQDPELVTASATDHWPDVDGDGFGDGDQPPVHRCAAPLGYVPDPTDCDDTSALVFPGAQLWADVDGDGFGDDATGPLATPCDPGPIPVASVGGDCDDGDATRSPGLPEVCVVGDDDCDGLADAADPDLVEDDWFLDQDGDGWGQAALVTSQCGQPAGHALLAGDCDDLSGARNPGSTELCNAGVDDDCDGLADAADPDLGSTTTWYLDVDGDGYGDPLVSLDVCGAPGGYVPLGTDCDDADPTRSPAAPERCNGRDDDCDGTSDQGASLVGVPTYRDGDGDGFGDPAGLDLSRCAPEPGWVLDATDCDDADQDRYPGQVVWVGASVESAVQSACDPAIALLVADVTVGANLVLIDRDVTLRGATSGTKVHVDPVIGGAPVLTVVGGSLTVEDVLFEVGPTQVNPLVVADDAVVTLRGIEVGGAWAPGLSVEGALVDAGSGSLVTIEDSDVHGLQAASPVRVTDGALVVRSTRFSGNAAITTSASVAAIRSDLLLEDVVLQDVPGGGSLLVVRDGTFLFSGVEVRDTTPPVFVRGTATGFVDGWIAEDAAPLVFEGTGSSTVRDSLFVRSGASADGAVRVTGGSVQITNSTFLASDSHGIVSSATVNLATSTLVGFAGSQVKVVAPGVVDVVSSIAWSEAPWPGAEQAGGTLSLGLVGLRSGDGSPAGSTIPAASPDFQTYLPALDPLRWDVHLRATSPFVDEGLGATESDGTAADLGTNAGALFDAWYSDVDPSDGMGDGWADWWLGPSAPAAGDPDGDGLDNAGEYANGTDPTSADTDGDGQLDSVDGPLY
jgi:hypothetical protein